MPTRFPPTWEIRPDGTMVYREWFRNGRLHLETTYFRKKKHGYMMEWRSNGQKCRYTPFQRGLRHGKEVYWDNDMSFTYENTYEKNVSIGFQYYVNGVPQKFWSAR